MSEPIRTRQALEEAMSILWSSERDTKAEIQELLDAARERDALKARVRELEELVSDLRDTRLAASEGLDNTTDYMRYRNARLK